MQAHVARSDNTDFIVVGGRRCRAALDHPGQIDILTRQFDQGAGLQPTRFLFYRQGPCGGTDLQQGQIGVVLADRTVDPYIIEAIDENETAGIKGGKMTGAVGLDADLTGLFVRACSDDDVALRGQIALEEQGVRGIDDNVSVIAASDKIALDHSMPAWVEGHATAQGFQHPGAGQGHVLIAISQGAAVEVDGVVTANPPGDGDLAAGGIGFADVHDRSALTGIDRVTAAGLGRGRRELAKTELVGMTAGNRLQTKGVVASEHQATVVEGHLDVGIIQILRTADHRCACRGLNDGKVSLLNDRLKGFNQRAKTRGSGVDGSKTHSPLHDMGAQINGEVERNVSAQMAVSVLGKCKSGKFLGPCRGENRKITGSGQGDTAVFLPSFEMNITADDNALVGPGVFLGDSALADAAANVNRFTREQITPQTNLAIGLDADGGCSVIGLEGAAEVATRGIVTVEHLSAGDQLAVNFGVLGRRDSDAAVGVGRGHTRRTGHLHADAVTVGPTNQFNALISTNGRTDLNLTARLCGSHPTEVELTG